MGPSSVLSGKEKRKQKEFTVKGDVRELPLFVGDGWLPVDGRSASERVLHPNPTAIDMADFVTYVKQDGQKADDAKVPTYLWSFFISGSLLLYFGIESGTRVDWKRGHTNVYQRHDWKRQEGYPRVGKRCWMDLDNLESVGEEESSYAPM